MGTGSVGNLAGALEQDAFSVVRHDVVEPFELADEVDLVFHLASPASPMHYLRHPIATMKVALYGTVNMLEFARSKRARFVLASSSEIYGDPLVQPQPEGYWGNVNPIGPRSAYGEGKRFAEAATMVFHREGLDVGIVRPFNVYGPRLSFFDGRVVSTFLRQALAGEAMTVFGDGKQTRSLCYVDDAVRGIHLLGVSGEQEPVNLGNPEEVTMLELAQTVKRVTSSPSEIVFMELPVDDPARRVPDIARAKARLGWEPTVSLEQGLERMLEAAAAGNYLEN